MKKPLEGVTFVRLDHVHHRQYDCQANAPKANSDSGNKTFWAGGDFHLASSPLMGCKTNGRPGCSFRDSTMNNLCQIPQAKSRPEGLRDGYGASVIRVRSQYDALAIIQRVPRCFTITSPFHRNVSKRQPCGDLWHLRKHKKSKCGESRAVDFSNSV